MTNGSEKIGHPSFSRTSQIDILRHPMIKPMRGANLAIRLKDGLIQGNGGITVKKIHAPAKSWSQLNEIRNSSLIT